MSSIDPLSWWEWPDFARVALVLAAVAAAGLLGSLLVRAARNSARPPARLFNLFGFGLLPLTHFSSGRPLRLMH